MSNIRKRGMRKGFDPYREIDHIQEQIKEYFGSNRVAVIGMSGGKDSTIAGKLLVNALGADRVIGVLMPDGEQSDFDMAMRAIDELGMTDNAIVVNIGDVTKACYDTLNNAYKLNNQHDKGIKFEVTDNVTINTPPRMRMSMLYAIAASQPNDARVINTCNASEDYIGYSTKHGDAAGDFAVLQEYTVSEIYAIGDALGINKELVHKKPSDGLCGLCDEDRFGFSYEDLDEFIVTGIAPTDEIRDKIVHMHNANLHKLVPMPKVHRLNYKYA